ncbi:MAG: YggS family pyridoxal phosphate enzyme [Candidatus Pelagibacter sp. TMED202]|nr:MAG: YggS family pyridoxal phosphate enzyme [Candidatus Pelagibacter sp. TMED202]
MSINYKALNQINADLEGKKAKLLIVTKTRSQDDIFELIESGYRDFAENRVQEAYMKYSKITAHTKINLSLIGPLQSNKVKQALNLFDTIQSIDRSKIVDEIIKYKDAKTKTKNFFIQINIGEEPQKSGVLPENFNEFYYYCKSKGLEISGIMCIPPLNKDPRYFFEKMLKIRKNIDDHLTLSMGMSSDYKIALDLNSNEIRVGSLIFL